MIRSYADLRAYQRADFEVLEHGKASWHQVVLLPNYRFVWLLRVGEYTRNCWRSAPLRVLGGVVRYLIRRHGWRYGYSIPWNVFGPGLWLFHVGTVVVNHDARVGERCSIHAGVTIGRHPGSDPGARATPRIGDACWIGPGATIIGGIDVGDHVIVGANSVVNRDVPDQVTVAGAPAVVVGSGRTTHHPPLIPVLPSEGRVAPGR
jgi:serine O-acetyltransferase